LTSGPICGDCIQGICEIGERAKGELEKLRVEMCWGASGFFLWNSSPCILDIFGWSPLILLYAISLPVYEVFKLPSEDLAVHDALYLIFFDSIMNGRGWHITLAPTL